MPSAKAYHALVVGITDYDHVRTLPRVDDARDVSALYYLDMTDDAEFETGIARLVGQVRQPPGTDNGD